MTRRWRRIGGLIVLSFDIAQVVDTESKKCPPPIADLTSIPETARPRSWPLGFPVDSLRHGKEAHLLLGAVT